MATFPSFDEYYRPQLMTHLQQNVDFMEEKVNEVRQTNNVTEAERLLDQACDQFVGTIKVRVDEMKASVKQKGTTCTTLEDKQRYELYVAGVATGIRSTQGLFEKIFDRIRGIVKTVVDWIREGLTWTSKVVTDTFTSIRSFFSN